MTLTNQNLVKSDVYRAPFQCFDTVGWSMNLTVLFYVPFSFQ